MIRLIIYVFGRSLHQQEYEILIKGFENGLCKKQVATANLSLLQSMVSEMEAVFYNDYMMIQQINLQEYHEGIVQFLPVEFIISRVRCWQHVVNTEQNCIHSG